MPYKFYPVPLVCCSDVSYPQLSRQHSRQSTESRDLFEGGKNIGPSSYAVHHHATKYWSFFWCRAPSDTIKYKVQQSTDSCNLFWGRQKHWNLFWCLHLPSQQVRFNTCYRTVDISVSESDGSWTRFDQAEKAQNQVTGFWPAATYATGQVLREEPKYFFKGSLNTCVVELWRENLAQTWYVRTFCFKNQTTSNSLSAFLTRMNSKKDENGQKSTGQYIFPELACAFSMGNTCARCQSNHFKVIVSISDKDEFIKRCQCIFVELARKFSMGKYTCIGKGQKHVRRP